eukprot:GDKJ01022088.1.p1 GENE.GDKJ01022088.1~~GDKJ01022088.1.p1  ORF type:complete len:208 (-),score=21.37 GDKJ01022088.1:16-639(-)
MYGLIKGLYELYTRRPEAKILVLGLSNAGKTTIIEQIKALHNQRAMGPKSIIPTIGFNMGKVQVDDWDIILWDVGGGPTVRSLWGRYITDADIILYVVDSSDPSRLEESKQVFTSYIIENPDVQAETQVALLCNKQDLSSAVTPEAIQEYFGIHTCKNRTIPVMPCSGTSKTSVRPLLRTLMDMIPSEQNKSTNLISGSRSPNIKKS